jgi:hypothetical protein
MGQATSAIIRRGNGLTGDWEIHQSAIAPWAPEFHAECSVRRSVLGVLFDFFEKYTESGITMK